jgi:hypothetical protein
MVQANLIGNTMNIKCMPLLGGTEFVEHCVNTVSCNHQVDCGHLVEDKEK